MFTENKDIIDLKQVLNKLLAKKKTFYIVLPITFVLSCIVIVLVPRYYKSSVSLAPESENVDAAGALGSIVSSIGLDFSNSMSSDAIYPMLYPELFESNDFVVKLLDIQIETIDGEIKTDYFNYLSKHQKQSPWDPAVSWLKGLVKTSSKANDSSSRVGKNGELNPFMLTERQTAIVELVKKKIVCDIDKQTMVVTITVTDQDPLVAAMLADSVRQRLQDFIITYRTSKARADYDYYDKLTQEAKSDYDSALRKYAVYCDTHKDMILQTSLSERDDLENDMQIKYNTYTAMTTQLQAAKARIQEKTPAFSVLQSATVPIKPDGPKRMFFVIGMLFLAFMVTSLIIVRKELFSSRDE